MNAETARLILVLADARQRNADREAAARADGGTYDPILRKWIAWNETGPDR